MNPFTFLGRSKKDAQAPLPESQFDDDDEEERPDLLTADITGIYCGVGAGDLCKLAQLPPLSIRQREELSSGAARLPLAIAGIGVARVRRPVLICRPLTARVTRRFHAAWSDTALEEALGSSRCVVPLQGHIERVRSLVSGQVQHIDVRRSDRGVMFAAGVLLGGGESGQVAMLTLTCARSRSPACEAPALLMRDVDREAWLASGSLTFKELRRHLKLAPAKQVVRREIALAAQ
jgi:hypothetical protein